jgi:ribosomal protein L37AE/L43A
MRGSSLVSRSDSFVCPLCEASKLYPSDRDSMRCESCAESLSGATLETLKRIAALPDAQGGHACEECGHPEMRRLPDGVFHCPACGSEVLPIDAPSALSKPDQHSQAYWAGWVDGHLGEVDSFTDNANLATWENPSDRLAYYRGHRAGSESLRDVSGALSDCRREMQRLRDRKEASS